MVLTAEHKIQGAELDLDPTPPTLHRPKHTRLHPLIPKPTHPTPKPTHLHPLDVDPTPPPGSLFCSEGLLERALSVEGRWKARAGAERADQRRARSKWRWNKPTKLWFSVITPCLILA